MSVTTERRPKSAAVPRGGWLLFADDERTDLAKPLVARILLALEEEDFEQARRLARSFSLKRETVPLHDFQRNKITALLSWIARKYGEEQLYEGYREAVRPWYSDSLRKGNDEGIVAPLTVDREFLLNLTTVGRTRGFEYLKVVEDDEKFMVTQLNAGDRMRRDGFYDPDGPYGFYWISGPKPMTYSYERYDIYNAHNAVGDILVIERGGTPLGTKGAYRSDGFKVNTFYKDPAAYPPDAYERLGKVKPSGLIAPEPSGQREFSEEELQNLVRPLEDQVRQFLEAEEYGEAAALLRRIEVRWARIRRVYDLWPAGLVEWIRDTHGTLDAYDAVRDALDRCVRPLIQSLAGETEREIVERLAAYYRANLSTFGIEEDVETVTFLVEPSQFLRLRMPTTVSFRKEKLDTLVAARELLEYVR